MDELKNQVKVNNRLPNAQAGSDRREPILIKPTPLQVESIPTIAGMIGSSVRMRQLALEITRKARYDLDTLIEGETGTGKNVAARAIYEASSRAGKPWVKVNSANFQNELFESELFGNEKGSFTGATERRIGLMESAHKGVMFFDEIAEMPLRIQAKVLTALEEKCFMRVGGREQINCDVRILYATRHDLEAMIREGTFREDLYYRIRTLRLKIPSLDERRDDIPALVHDTLQRIAKQHDREQPFSIQDQAMAMLLERSWPGNIRDLQHAVTDIAIHVDGEGRNEITTEDVDLKLGANLGKLAVGERETDAKSISVPPYLIGEGIQHFLDRTAICIHNTLLDQTMSPKRVGAILKAHPHTLRQRLKRAHERITRAAQSAQIAGFKIEDIGRVRKASEPDEEDDSGKFDM